MTGPINKNRPKAPPPPPKKQETPPPAPPPQPQSVVKGGLEVKGAESRPKPTAGQQTGSAQPKSGFDVFADTWVATAKEAHADAKQLRQSNNLVQKAVGTVSDTTLNLANGTNETIRHASEFYAEHSKSDNAFISNAAKAGGVLTTLGDGSASLLTYGASNQTGEEAKAHTVGAAIELGTLGMGSIIGAIGKSPVGKALATKADDLTKAVANSPAGQFVAKNAAGFFKATGENLTRLNHLPHALLEQVKLPGGSNLAKLADDAGAALDSLNHFRKPPPATPTPTATSTADTAAETVADNSALASTSSTTASVAGEEFSTRYSQGQLLGNGRFKDVYADVYAVAEDPDAVLAVISRSDPKDPGKPLRLLQEEKAMLDTLGKEGVPVARLEVGTFEGKAAAIQQRFEVGSKAPEWNQLRFKVMNEQTLTDIRTIRQKLNKSGLVVKDAQILVSKEGRAVLADPAKVYTPGSIKPEVSNYWNHHTNTTLDRLEVEAQLAIQRRGGPQVTSEQNLQKRFLDVPEGAESRNTLVNQASKDLRVPGGPPKAQQVADALAQGRLSVKRSPSPGKPAPNEVRVPLGTIYDDFMSNVVYKGLRKMDPRKGGIEREIDAALGTMRFRQARGMGDSLSTDPLFAKSDKLLRDPEQLVRTLEVGAGEKLDDVSREAAIRYAEQSISKSSGSAPKPL